MVLGGSGLTSPTRLQSTHRPAGLPRLRAGLGLQEPLPGWLPRTAAGGRPLAMGPLQRTAPRERVIQEGEALGVQTHCPQHPRGCFSPVCFAV